MQRPHISSVIGFGSWGLTLVALIPDHKISDLIHLDWQSATVWSTTVLFLAVVLAIQVYMGHAAVSTSFVAPVRLIVTGPFRFTRNPIYCAGILPIAAVAVYSIPMSISGCLIYVVAMTQLVIAAEERQLLETFGEVYRVYAAETPRWILRWDFKV